MKNLNMKRSKRLTGMVCISRSMIWMMPRTSTILSLRGRRSLLSTKMRKQPARMQVRRNFPRKKKPNSAGFMRKITRIFPSRATMTLFSDNPGLERMMQQKPAGRQVSEERPAPAPDSPCYDCGYGKGRRCVGICYKKLMGERRKTA